MAIRFPVDTSENALGWSLFSGYRSHGVAGQGLSGVSQVIARRDRFQPSALSRPGNLGTAYSGVWTENVTTPNDNHRPIPFKLLVGSLIYPAPFPPLRIQ